MYPLNAGFGVSRRAPPRAGTHNFFLGVIHGCLIAVPLWLVILKAFGVI